MENTSKASLGQNAQVETFMIFYFSSTSANGFASSLSSVTKGPWSVTELLKFSWSQRFNILFLLDIFWRSRMDFFRILSKKMPQETYEQNWEVLGQNSILFYFFISCKSKAETFVSCLLFSFRENTIPFACPCFLKSHAGVNIPEIACAL